MSSTLADVAKAAGLSSGTVSQILRNNDGRYSARTRERVLAVAKELDYQPNALAQSIRSGRSGIIGLLIPCRWNIAADPFASLIISHLEQTLLVSGRKILLASLTDDDLEAMRLPDILTRRYVDAVLVYGCHSEDYLKHLHRNCPEMVVIDEILPRLPSLTSDHAGGGRMAAECLWRNGHRNFAIFDGEDREDRNFALRSQAFRARIGELGGDSGRVTVYRDDVWSRTGGQRAAAEMRKKGDPATAIFALNDFLAFNAVRFFLDHGIRVPEDLSVVGFDDTALATALHPALTTIHVDRQAMAEQAVAMLEELMGGGGCVNRIVPVHLVERESVGRIGGK